MTPGEVAARKAELDKQLRGGGFAILTVGFGLSLWSALCRSGDIAFDDFPNAAFGLQVPDAEPSLRLPAYGKSGRVCATYSKDLPLDAFRIGEGYDAR